MRRNLRRAGPPAIASALGIVAAAAIWVPSMAADGSATSAPPRPASLQEVELTLTTVATASAPIDGVVGPGGTMWFAEQAGTVRVLDGQVLGPPVLDITAETVAEGERGLLGIAFDSAFAHFYISFTDLTGTSHVDEIAVLDGQLQLETRRTVLTQSQPFENHNGGGIVFGPDGMLYIGFGDGGSSGDPQDNGQDLTTFLGKILRIDPSGGDPYAIPPDNPFVGDPDALDEIWAYGLRNPWRFSFDSLTGDLWIADVGQNLREEINRAPAGVGGQNYGWSRMEGTLPFSGDEPANHVPPIFEYDNDGARCAVTGGYVYRGDAIPALQGSYVFSDYCESDIRALQIQDGDVVGEANLISVPIPGTLSIAQGPEGELYVLTSAFGLDRISRIDSTQPSPSPSMSPSESPSPSPSESPSPTPSESPSPSPSESPSPSPSESPSPSPSPSPSDSPTPSPSPTPPVGQCAVSVGLDQWQNGVVASYTITNNGPTWSGWTMTFTVSPGVTHQNGWNGRFTQNGTEITITNETWNGSVATGQSVTPGHLASHTGTVSATGFAVNGEPCTVS